MLSDRIQRQIDRLLDEAETAVSDVSWDVVRDRAQSVLAFDPENSDALAFKAAAERRELREACKKHRAPAVVPEEARANKYIAQLESMAAQITNEDSSATMRGFAVSSGQVTAKASLVLGPADFDKMEPGSILVAPLTTPAWTQLFAHAAGLVTDLGSILAHGSIVAREYGIPAVLGVGNGTERITHGQLITIDGDAGTVTLLDE